MEIEHVKFKKIGRFLDQKVIVSEKIDGTNALIYIGENQELLTGSRSRWITPENDNYGFAKWVEQNREDVLKLGVGFHYGEWWGLGIQRKYEMKKKVFSLFNCGRWQDNPDKPECCDVVPHVFTGMLEDYIKQEKLTNSLAAERYGINYTRVEGCVIWFNNSKLYLKDIFDK